MWPKCVSDSALGEQVRHDVHQSSSRLHTCQGHYTAAPSRATTFSELQGETATLALLDMMTHRLGTPLSGALSSDNAVACYKPDIPRLIDAKITHARCTA